MNAQDLNQEIIDKLGSARTKLILDKPFLGALVLRLPLVEADKSWCPTTATDAKNFYYNAEYIEQLKASEVQFVLAHEALHCALSHFARREHRIKHRWDLACDYAINPILKNEGLHAPTKSLFFKEYDGMTAEEIYPLLKDNDQSETLDQHLYDKQDKAEGGQDSKQNPLDQQDTEQGQSESPQQPQNNPNKKNQAESGAAGQNPVPDDSKSGAMKSAPEPLTEQEKSNLSTQWQQRMAGAAQQAMQAGKMGEGMARLIDFMLQPQLPWRHLMSRYFNNMAKDDYSYTRPTSRRGDPAILPSLRSAQLNAVVAIDVSGSVTDEEMSEFISEVNALKSQVRSKVTLLACDSRLSKECPWVFEAWDFCELPSSLSGGGGTKFSPVFDWVAKLDVAPDLLIYFTDAKGEFPVIEPTYPVVWLVKGKEDVPFGQRIQLN
ncbi:MAG: hypothetical protein ISR69_04155 [Gammaproteobacteria bacterium]|nr:hypothetical protein [Gammaproteobacteria bacterium]